MNPSDTQPKSTAEAEREVSQARDELGGSLDALQDKLNPGRLLDEALAYLKGNGDSYGDALIREARANPVAAIMAGVGIGWLVLGAQRRESERRTLNRPDQPPRRAEAADGRPASAASDRVSGTPAAGTTR